MYFPQGKLRLPWYLSSTLLTCTFLWNLSPTQTQAEKIQYDFYYYRLYSTNISIRNEILCKIQNLATA